MVVVVVVVLAACVLEVGAGTKIKVRRLPHRRERVRIEDYPYQRAF